MNKTFYLLPFLILILACGGGGKANIDESLSKEIDSIQSVGALDSMSEELGDLKLEIEGRKNELDSLMKEIEKDSE